VQENLLDRLQKELKELKEAANISLADNAVSSLQQLGLTHTQC